MSAEYKYGDKVEITSGRLKGESGTVIGETNLNMNHLWIVRRHKRRVRNKQMGFRTDELFRRNTNEFFRCN